MKGALSAGNVDILSPVVDIEQGGWLGRCDKPCGLRRHRLDAARPPRVLLTGGHPVRRGRQPDMCVEPEERVVTGLLASVHDRRLLEVPVAKLACPSGVNHTITIAQIERTPCLGNSCSPGGPSHPLLVVSTRLDRGQTPPRPAHPFRIGNV